LYPVILAPVRNPAGLISLALYTRRGNREVVLRRKLSVLWAAAIMLLTVLVCSGVALAITFGQPDGNRHPNVGALVDGSIAYCSGTLISETVFLTAAHCGTEGETVMVTFDSQYSGSSSTTYDGTFHADPLYSTGGASAIRTTSLSSSWTPIKTSQASQTSRQRLCLPSGSWTAFQRERSSRP
jgi:hypothetical protein